MQALVIWP